MKKGLTTFIFLLFTLLFLWSCKQKAQSQPQAQPAQPPNIPIDATLQLDICDVLIGNDEAQKQQMIDSVLRHPNDYIPPVLYDLSTALFKQNKKDEACFWYHVAYIRARFSANLYADSMAYRYTNVFAEVSGRNIVRYSYRNLNMRKTIVSKSIAFVKNNAENYDPAWMLGMTLPSRGICVTKKLANYTDLRMQAIKSQTIEEFTSSFDQTINDVEARVPANYTAADCDMFAVVQNEDGAVWKDFLSDSLFVDLSPEQKENLYKQVNQIFKKTNYSQDVAPTLAKDGVGQYSMFDSKGNRMGRIDCSKK